MRLKNKFLSFVIGIWVLIALFTIVKVVFYPDQSTFRHFKYLVVTALFLIIPLREEFFSYFRKRRNKCPYRPSMFYKEVSKYTKNNVVSLSCNPKSLVEKITNRKICYIPVVVLINGIVKLNKNLSKINDNNKVDENFKNILEKNCGKTIFNNPTYRLIEIKGDQIKLGLSDYLKTISTCDIHFYNLINSKINNKVMIENNIERKKLLESIVCEHNFTSISASLGFSCLTVLKNYNSNNYEYLISTNTDKKNANNSRHVVPSFMFQPCKNDINNHSNVSQMMNFELQMLKEFAEEILGDKSIENALSYDDLWLCLNNNKIITNLKKLLQNGNAKFVTLGLVLDIYRMRPEVMSVLIIEDKDFKQKIHEDFLRQRKELGYESDNQFLSFEVKNINTYEINDEEKYKNLLTDTNVSMEPPGAACLKMGRDYMLNYIKGQS